MKLLMISYAFYPSVGGVESSALMLAEQLKKKSGYDIRIVTDTCLGNRREMPGFEIDRRPSMLKLARLARWADVVYQHNPSLNYLLPSLMGVPTVVSIRTWICRPGGRKGWQDRVKFAVLRNFTCISNSRATAASLPFPSVVIENAYDDSAFTNRTRWDDRSGMAFVGRLVSDKGVETALAAARLLRERGYDLPFYIAGDGPLRAELEECAKSGGLGGNVRFTGNLSPSELAALLNTVKYLVIPSVWAEPFGIVALEGIACGCIPIGTNQGGLVDAIGKCGPLFKAGNPEELADTLAMLQSDERAVDIFRNYFAEHLTTHSPDSVSALYAEVIQSLVRHN